MSSSFRRGLFWVACLWWSWGWVWRAGGRVMRSRPSVCSLLTSPTSETSPAGCRCTLTRSTCSRCPCTASTPASREWVHQRMERFSFYIVQLYTQYWFHSYQRKQDSKAQAPHFTKPKDEGWFLVLGEVEKKELLAIKRVGFIRNHSSVSVAFYTPEKTGK